MSDSWICNGWTFKLIILINNEQSTKIVKTTSTDGGGYNKISKRYSDHFIGYLVYSSWRWSKVVMWKGLIQ